MKKYIPYILSTLLAGFGLLTLFLSTSVIFDLFGIRAKEGNYVLFIVWANFISAILYLAGAYGLIKQQRWPAFALGASFLILIVAFIGLKSHISDGLAYEVKTVSAMIFRISITLVLTILAYFTIDRYKIKN